MWKLSYKWRKSFASFPVTFFLILLTLSYVKYFYIRLAERQNHNFLKGFNNFHLRLGNRLTTKDFTQKPLLTRHLLAYHWLSQYWSVYTAPAGLSLTFFVSSCFHAPIYAVLCNTIDWFCGWSMLLWSYPHLRLKVWSDWQWSKC